MEFNKNIFKVLCVTELPSPILECHIVTPPEIIDYFLYKITDIITLKYYWGKHKWDGDVYWHSGKHEELNKLWSTESKRFKYEVIEFGSEEYISDLEAQLINEAFDKKDPLIWNKQRAIVRKKDLEKDSQIVTHVYNNTINGKYKTVSLTKKEVKNIDFKQCRQTKVFNGKVLEIADRIKGNGGNTGNCKPLIILQDRFGPGKHLGINGYHTKCGFLKVKNATIIDAIFIPKDDHKKIPDSLLTRLGNTFNKKSNFVQTFVEKDDLIKELKEEVEAGYTHTDDYIKNRAQSELNFSARQAGVFLRNYHKLQKNISIISSKKKQFTHYSASHMNDIAKNVKKQYPNKTVWVSASSTFGLDRIYRVMKNENSYDAIVVIYHGSPMDEENWVNYKCDEFMELHTFSKSILNIEYHSITGWSDTDIVS